MEQGLAEPRERFSLVVGGPFHAVLRRLGLIAADQLPTWRAALGLALLAWLLPAVLVIVQSLVDEGYAGWEFFTDWTVYTRYLFAIGILIATERYADGRLLLLVRHFREARILSGDHLAGFGSALSIADNRSGSALAELVILAAALLWSTLTTQFTVSIAGTSWEGTVAAGDNVLSWAGQAARFVSTPVFLFLVLRWIWRFVVWGELLYRIARLPLRLMPMHPDRAGGLGFMAIYPSIFSGFVFALGCVVAAAMVKDLGLEQHAPQTVWFALAGWLVISVGLVLGPLLVFARPLYAARERALIEYGRIASQHHLAFHRKWIAEGRSGEELMGSPDPSSASDLNACLQAVNEMRVFPIDRPAIMQLVISAGAPLLAVVVTQMPLGELVKWLLGTIL